MTGRPVRILLIGYGNPGRLDDGLGPALAAAIEPLSLPGVTVDSNYQLNVEDAAPIAEHDVVIFADADVACAEPFVFRRLAPKTELSFSTHSVDPAALLAIARDMFDAEAPGYMLGVRGYEFNAFGERLSQHARANFEAALAFLEPLLRGRDVARIADAARFDAPGVPPAFTVNDDERR
jgi:hydrogenase maturation protease